MMRLYREKRFRPEQTALIELSNKILSEYDVAVTVRHLYYRHIGVNSFPNTKEDYRRFAVLINDARLAGLIDWDSLEDSSRLPRIPSEWDSASDIVGSAIRSFRLPRWKGQKHYIELWTEKDAMTAILAPIANEFHIPYSMNKGYNSQGSMYKSSQRIIEIVEELEITPVVLYVGDFDPSGEDMVRDITDRMEMFEVPNLIVEKVVLTMTQVRRHRLPPNPLKLKRDAAKYKVADGSHADPRGKAYRAKHGDQSWEVDALPLRSLQSYVRVAIEKYIDDPDSMDAIKEREEKIKERLRTVGDELDSEEGEE